MNFRLLIAYSSFIFVVGTILLPLLAQANPPFAITIASVALEDPASMASWAPEVDWSVAVTCQYRYGSDDYQDVDCGSSGADIPVPPSDGTWQLDVLGYDAEEGIASDSITFDYYETIPAGCMDTEALNYDPSAITDDGTCMYDTTPPTVSIAGPSDAEILGLFLAQVGWGDATACSYRHDGGAEQVVACEYVTEIPPPATSGEHTLYVYGEDDAGNRGEASVTYTYSPAPLFGDDTGEVTDIYNGGAIVEYHLLTQGSTAVHTIDVKYATETIYGGGAYDQQIHYEGSFANDGGMNLDGLNCGTAYHFVFVAINDDYISTSTDKTFSTSDCDIPLVTITVPEYGVSYSAWEPVIDWDGALTCEYNYDDTEWIIADCDAAGADIPAPETYEGHILYIRGHAGGEWGSDDALFIYELPAPPTVVITTPTDGATTRWWSPEVDWGGADVCNYNLGAGWLGVDCSQDGSDISAPADGAYTLSVRGSLGGSAWGEDNVGFTYDTTGPSVAILAPTDGITVVPESFAAEVDWDGAIECFYSYDGFGNVFDVDCDAAGADIPAPFDTGLVTLSVLARDEAGNGEEVSVTFTAGEEGEEEGPGDSISPVVAVSMQAESEATTTLWVLFTAEASDETELAGVTFYVDGGPIALEDTSAPYEILWNTSATSTGVKRVIAVARDTSGNYATSSPVTFTLKRFSGEGTIGNPYELNSCDQFPFINDYLDASFELVADLDCASLEEDVMIGDEDSAFTGTFDGGGHFLLIMISETGEDGIGLFRITDGAIIRDIRLLAQVAGGSMTGSLVGVASDTTIINASSTAMVIGLGGFTSPPMLGTGGLVGTMVGGSIVGSRFDGQVWSFIAAGGIVGAASDGALISRSSSSGLVYVGAGGGGIVGYLLTGASVRNSYSNSAVELFEDVRDSLPISGALGGIAGIIFGGTVSRSYAAGIVGDTDLVYPSGGLVGLVSGPDNRIAYSFAAGSVVGGAEDTAGFVGGVFEGEMTLIGNAFDTAATGQSLCRLDTPGDFMGCEPVNEGGDMNYWKNTAHAPIDHFNTDVVWDVSQPGSYPMLRVYVGPEPTESDDPEEDDADDSEGDPDEELLRNSSGGTSAKKKTLNLMNRYLEGDNQERLKEYIRKNSDRLMKYHTDDTKLPKAVLELLGLGAGQASLPPVPLTTSLFVRDLKLGQAGEDVLVLQKFLNQNGFTIAAAGPGSPGNETEYFGGLTRAALVRYQLANHIVPAVGYFGPVTRSFMMMK